MNTLFCFDPATASEDENRYHNVSVLILNVTCHAFSYLFCMSLCDNVHQDCKYGFLYYFKIVISSVSLSTFGPNSFTAYLGKKLLRHVVGKNAMLLRKMLRDLECGSSVSCLICLVSLLKLVQPLFFAVHVLYRVRDPFCFILGSVHYF